MNFNRIVPDTIRNVVFNRAPVLRSDGTFVRDYIYVKDVVHAYLTLAEAMDDTSIHGEAFNFSNEDRLTVIELTRKILRLMNREDLEPVILNQAQGEIRDQHLSAAKARDVLDWRPRYTIDDALLETIEWYREYFSAVPDEASVG
jgi:CDP-glucose 4,6-dehydratase